MDRPADKWDLVVQLDSGAREPLFLQIARAITADIQRGRLSPGMRLPGSRTLAKRLAVHRNTVFAAYAELVAEGWLETSRASGTFVSRSLPISVPYRVAGSRVGGSPLARPVSTSRSRASRVSTSRATIGFPLPAERRLGPINDTEQRAPLATGVLKMSEGAPDTRLIPTAELARAYRRVLATQAPEVLTYGPAHGHLRLRSALAEMLRVTRGMAVEADSILITQGTQMALDLVARALVRTGDVVVVEELGYPPAWEAFRRHGARLITAPVDREGIDVAAIERLARKRQPRAIYVTPHHQYPTTVTLTAARRLALLALATRLRIPIIEDDYDHEFHYEGRPVLPLASADRGGIVIYLGTLAKVLAPGLRIGYVAAPQSLIDRLAVHRRYLDRQGDHALECAVAELIEAEKLQRHVRRSRRIYLARRDFLSAELERVLNGIVEFDKPSGGIAIWARVREGIDVEAWAVRAAQQNVAIRTGRRFSFDGRPRPFIRFGFAALDERELRSGVRRLHAVLSA